MDDGLKIILDNMQNEIHLAREDIRSLLEFRWKIAGARMVIDIIVIVGFQTLLAIIQSKGG